METNGRFDSSQSPKTAEDVAYMRDVPYREAVGSLMYTTIVMRPDIVFVVGILSHFNSNPGHHHWDTVKRVFRYLNRTRDLRLTYGRVPKEDLKDYTDTDGQIQED